MNASFLLNLSNNAFLNGFIFFNSSSGKTKFSVISSFNYKNFVVFTLNDNPCSRMNEFLISEFLSYFFSVIWYYIFLLISELFSFDLHRLPTANIPDTLFYTTLLKDKSKDQIAYNNQIGHENV
ncbi:MAG: hypothetical protein RLZZ546_3060 [Bacteroidota bacterium]